MKRAWADQVRINKLRYLPRGFRLLHPEGIKEWTGTFWIVLKADEVAILSTGKVRKIGN